MLIVPPTAKHSVPAYIAAPLKTVQDASIASLGLKPAGKTATALWFPIEPEIHKLTVTTFVSDLKYLHCWNADMPLLNSKSYSCGAPIFALFAKYEINFKGVIK